MELVSEALAVGRDIGQTEFSPLVEFPLDREFCSFDTHSEVRRTLRQLAQQSKTDRCNQKLERRRPFSCAASLNGLVAGDRIAPGNMGLL